MTDLQLLGLATSYSLKRPLRAGTNSEVVAYHVQTHFVLASWTQPLAATPLPAVRMGCYFPNLELLKVANARSTHEGNCGKVG
jgi:hypothetical protein